MRTRTTMLAVVLFAALTIAGWAEQKPAEKTESDGVQAVEQATNQFYESLDALLAGDASGMDAIWSHADDVTYMGPAGGVQIGWNQVRTMWAAQAEKRLGGHVEAKELQVTVGNDLALVQGYALGNVRNAQAGTQVFRLRATSSFRMENGQWKMIGHHSDLLNDGSANTARQPNTWRMRPDAARSADSIIVRDDEVILKLVK